MNIYKTTEAEMNAIANFHEIQRKIYTLKSVPCIRFELHWKCICKKYCVHWRIVTRIFTAICLRLVAIRAMNSFKKREKNRTNVEDVKRWVSLVTSSLLKNLYSYRVRRLFLIKIIMGLIAKFIFSPIVRSSRQLNYSQIMPCLLLCSNRQIKGHKHFFLWLLWKDLKEYILLQSRPTFWNVNLYCFMQKLHYEYGWHIAWISLSIHNAIFMRINTWKKF